MDGLLRRDQLWIQVFNNQCSQVAERSPGPYASSEKQTKLLNHMENQDVILLNTLSHTILHNGTSHIPSTRRDTFEDSTTKKTSGLQKLKKESKVRDHATYYNGHPQIKEENKSINLKKVRLEDREENIKTIFTHLEKMECRHQEDKIRLEQCSLPGYTSLEPSTEPTNPTRHVETKECRKRKRKKSRDGIERSVQDPSKSSVIAHEKELYVAPMIIKRKKKNKKCHDLESQPSKDCGTSSGQGIMTRESSSAIESLWDSQSQEGYKCPLSTPNTEKPVQSVSEGKNLQHVVQELLRNSSDKAYGTQVLTWNNEVSAVSCDADYSAKESKHNSATDEWDEGFDSGKMKKIKFRRDRWRTSNRFQTMQNRHNFWSATHPRHSGTHPRHFSGLVYRF